MGKFVPLSIPNFEGNEEKYVLDAVHQGWVSTGGAYITQLEEKMAEFLNVPMTVACQSGTAALHLALMECGVQPGDCVIVPTVTFIAAVNPVKYQFASPVFMDCDDSLCMDPEKLRLFCETECEKKADGLYRKADGSKVKAIVVVHVFGNLADMERIMQIADQYGLKVIEDATEALGSKIYRKENMRDSMRERSGILAHTRSMEIRSLRQAWRWSAYRKGLKCGKHAKYIPRRQKMMYIITFIMKWATITG